MGLMKAVMDGNSLGAGGSVVLDGAIRCQGIKQPDPPSRKGVKKNQDDEIDTRRKVYQVIVVRNWL